MKIDLKESPREYQVGQNHDITIKDIGRVRLEPNEQLTFLTPENAEYDLCRKDWGYYATPSVNDRLKRFGFKTALVQNSKGQVYVMIVEEDKIDVFEHYLEAEKNYILQWLDEIPKEPKE